MKVVLKVYGWLLHRVFNSGKKPLRQSLPVHKCNLGFLKAFIACILAAFILETFAYMSAKRKTHNLA